MTNLKSEAVRSITQEADQTGQPMIHPWRRGRDRLQSELSFFKRSAHVKLGLANLIGRALPIYAGGGVRARLYRRAGFFLGDGSAVLGAMSLRGSDPHFYQNLVVGSGCCIGDHVTINLDAPVTLGRNVVLSPNVVIYTATHAVGPGSARTGEVRVLPVTIQDGAWIRLGAIIVPGVTVGRGSVVAAGAVVLSDVPANSYVEGNPARVVRELPWGEERKVAVTQTESNVTATQTADQGADESLETLVALVLDVPIDEVNDSTCPANTPAWDSMAHLALIAAVEETYRVSVSAADERSMLSVEELRNLLTLKGVDA